MREFKFRSWNKKLKCWGGGISINRFGVASPSLQRKDVRNRGDTYHIMQYTGIDDKNGKEIYEGDILRVCHYEDEDAPEYNDFTTHEVYWGGADYPAFELRPLLSDDINGISYMVAGEPLWFEVAGNIYENPELVKQ